MALVTYPATGGLLLPCVRQAGAVTSSPSPRSTFSRSGPLTGNPVAVVHDAAGLDDDQMAAFARWTNLSETTFLLPPTDPAADYRLRIFTPAEELPFAGHPTLGSAHAWLEAGGVPATEGRIVQECGVGLVAAPARRTTTWRSGRRTSCAGGRRRANPRAGDRCAGDRPRRVLRSNWIDNGPGWLGLQLASADDVLDLRPDFAAMSGLEIGVIGAHDEARRGRARCRLRGARLLPRVLDPRGPGDRQSERGVRDVADPRRAPSRRLRGSSGDGTRARRPGADQHRRGGRHLGRWVEPHARLRHPDPLSLSLRDWLSGHREKVRAWPTRSRRTCSAGSPW